MISDLTTIGLKNLNRNHHILGIRLSDDQHYSYKDCRALVLTGTALQRRSKRFDLFRTEHQCECCGRFYMPKPWYRTYGLCESCYKREFIDNIRYDEYQRKPKWRFSSVNNTQRILDLLNRCY